MILGEGAMGFAKFGEKLPRWGSRVQSSTRDFQWQVEQGIESAVELEEMLLKRRPEEIFAAEDDADWTASSRRIPSGPKGSPKPESER